MGRGGAAAGAMGRLGAGLALVLAALFGGGTESAACGAADTACKVRTGSYRIVLPEQATGPVPAVVFLHGYGSSGAGILKNQTLVQSLTARGYAVIAPDGSMREGSARRSWTSRPGREGRDEAAFFDAVLKDASLRHDVDRGRTVLAGFSSGAFMVNYLACGEPDLFAAYAPVSGSFWRPQPETCAGPVRLFHSHGWSDGVVPLEGRALGGGRYQQGDAFAGLELWRQTNGCASHAPQKTKVDDGDLIRSWDCGAGADIRLVLFFGGHRIPKDWATRMLDWFEAK